LLGLEAKAFPDDKHAAWEILTVNSHSGTHLDSPWHYGPLCEGKPARTIDEMPLEWCFSDGVVLDLTHKKRGEEITVDDLKSALAKINYTLKPFDIVLIRTDAYKQYSQPNYEIMQPGMGRESTLWLIDQGIKVMGIDAWGWDRPYDVMKAEYLAGIKSTLFESHRAGREQEFWHAEKMANFDQIPKPYGFTIAIFPVKIERASAGWTRAVAIIEE
jgi:kynurenine formamidase